MEITTKDLKKLSHKELLDFTETMIEIETCERSESRAEIMTAVSQKSKNVKRLLVTYVMSKIFNMMDRKAEAK